MCQKIAILPPVAPKPKLRSKSFRSMTPPKVRILRPNKVLGAQKGFWGPHKTQKNDFLKKLDLYDLAAHSQGRNIDYFVATFINYMVSQNKLDFRNLNKYDSCNLNLTFNSLII